MVSSPAELKAAADEASQRIQAISDYIAEHPEQAALGKIRFPRGFIGTAMQKRQLLSFVQDKRIRANISYALMTHDVLRWVITRTDIAGQAKEMIIKEAVCLSGSICETLTIFRGEVGLGRNSAFNGRINHLRDQGIITQQLHDDLTWLWQKRNQEHIIDNDFYEFSHYTTEDWRRSVRAYRDLRDSLALWRAPAP